MFFIDKSSNFPSLLIRKVLAKLIWNFLGYKAKRFVVVESTKFLSKLKMLLILNGESEKNGDSADRKGLELL